MNKMFADEKPDIEGTWHELKYHKLCTVFPPMEDEEYDSLIASMRNNGYIHVDPIVVIDVNDGGPGDPQYQILDGRNRHTAAIDAGVVPTFIEFIGGDPVSFVLARNTDRRHMTVGQKASVASKLANIKVGSTGAVSGRGSADVSRGEAAAALGTSVKSVQRFRQVEAADKELAAEVEAGKVSLNEAVEKVTGTKPSAQTSVAPPVKVSGTAPAREPLPKHKTFKDVIIHGDREMLLGMLTTLLTTAQQKEFTSNYNLFVDSANATPK